MNEEEKTTRERMADDTSLSFQLSLTSPRGTFFSLTKEIISQPTSRDEFGSDARLTVGTAPKTNNE